MSATTPTDTPNSFTLLEQFHKYGVEDDLVLDKDDAATIQGLNAAPPSYTRITFKTPMDELAKDKPKATLLKAKESIDCLQVPLSSVKILPWKTEEVDIHTNILDSLPTDPKIAEAFLLGYSRFFAKPNTIFCLLLQHDSSVIKEEIEEFGRVSINQPRVQFLQPSQSDAIQPTILGFLTGSTPEMASSHTLGDALKKIFNIKVLGMKWNSVNIKNAPKNSSWRDRQALTIEADATECRDQDTLKRMHLYFNNKTRDTAKTVFGTPMMFVPTPMGWQNIACKSLNIRKMILGQAAIVNSLASVELDNVDLMNKVDSEGTTLMQALMSVESIVSKKNKSDKEIFGRLFHAITPTSDPSCYTVSFFNVNTSEASSVIVALPLFIESHFGN